MPRMPDVAGVLASIPATVVDLVIAATLTWISLATATGSYPPSGSRPFDALGVVLTSLVGAALVARRRYPLAVMALCVTLVAGFEARGYWLSLNQLAIEVAFFTVASRCSRRWIVAAAAVVYPELMYSNIHEWVGSAFAVYLGTAVRVAAIGVVGDGARRLTEIRGIMAAYREEMQRKQADREQRAVLLERFRIARELHDVTAHHLSVIAVQAGLARYVLATDTETTDQALRTISEVGSEGLAELRRLISLLRPEDEDGNGARADDRPAPGIAQLPVLVERVGLSGTPSRYAIAGHQRPLPAGMELCVYRVVQESLTNVLKHAPGSSVDVRLEYEPEHIRVVVTDTGPAIPAQRSRSPRSAVAQSTEHTGSGVGLTGMRERAALYAGELSAGRNADGGFEVVLILPVAGEAVEGVEAAQDGQDAADAESAASSA